MDHNTPTPPLSGTESISSGSLSTDLTPEDLALLERDVAPAEEDDNNAPISDSMHPEAFKSHVEVLLTAENVPVSEFVAPFQHVSDRKDELKREKRTLFSMLAMWQQDTAARFAERDAKDAKYDEDIKKLFAMNEELVAKNTKQEEVLQELLATNTKQEEVIQELKEEIQELQKKNTEQDKTIQELQTTQARQKTTINSLL